MNRSRRAIFAQNIKNLRELHGWSQEYVAEKLGVNQKQISKYESGKDWVGPDALVAYHRLFRVPIPALLGLEPVLASTRKKPADITSPGKPDLKDIK